MSLSQSINRPGGLEDDAKAKVFVCLSNGGPPSKPPSQASLQKFINHYMLEPKYLTFGCRPGSYPISCLSRITHENVLDLVEILSRSKNQTRLQILQDVRHGGFWQLQSDKDTSRVLDLAVRMWLMLNVRDTGLNAIIHQSWGSDALDWDDHESLNDVIVNAFPRSDIELDFKEGRLDPGFTAFSLEDICGLKISWTKSLHNHLRLDRRSKVLLIFPFTDFLVGHLEPEGRKVYGPARAGKGRSPRAASQVSSQGTNLIGNSNQQYEPVLPRELLEETIRTLLLLFPNWDKKTQKLLDKYDKTDPDLAPFFEEIAAYKRPQRLSLRDFSFWRDRLLELHETIYLAPPDTWRQMLLDRRNPLQYYTFWIAIIVFIFSLGSFILSIIQTWATIRGLNENS